MSIKKKEQIYQIIIVIAILLGIVIGVAMAWLFMSPATTVIDCYHSGGAIVMQDDNPPVCLERK